MTLDQLYGHPNALAAHYSRFRVADRLLLTGHSHQAWPDRAFYGQMRAFEDAAAHVDRKWDEAFAKAERVRKGWARLLGDRHGLYALGANTHELVVRFLSALPLAERPRLVATDGEFHSIRRQLDRLEEEGLEIVRISAASPADIASDLRAAIDERTAAVLVSAVLFQSARIVPGLGEVAEQAQRFGAELLVDVYHGLNVVPYDLEQQGLDGAFVVGGGYKYCQLGEGNCFLRFPPSCRLRPVITGWFAEFGDLEAPSTPSARVLYGTDETRFAGATYDPTSHYRAAEVFDFFADMALTPEVLREVSQHQVGVLAQAFDELDADPGIICRDRAVRLCELGGFLVLETSRAEELSHRLGERGVLTDFRGDRLRFGPAPYLCDRQLTDAMGLLGEVLKAT